MDAAAYLTRHGWRGDGHSLDPNDRGIKRRLLVSKRHGNIGIGKKKNDPAADQWWQGAFDGALKNLNVASPGSASPAPSPAPQLPIPSPALNRKWTGLYSSFVRGSTLTGTMDKPLDLSSATVASTKESSAALTELPTQWSSTDRSHVRFEPGEEIASTEKPQSDSKRKKSRKDKSSKRTDDDLSPSPVVADGSEPAKDTQTTDIVESEKPRKSKKRSDKTSKDSGSKTKRKRKG